jgi:hypothetical protein
VSRDVDLYRRLVAAQRDGSPPALDLAAVMRRAGGLEVVVDGRVYAVVGTAVDLPGFARLLVRAGLAVEAGRAAAEAAGSRAHADHDSVPGRLAALVLDD